MSNGRCEVCDAVNADDSRLKLDWTKMEGDWSIARVGDFDIVARPGSYMDASSPRYCAWISWQQHPLLDRDGFDTRLHAQIGAEALLHQMHQLVGFARKGVDAREQFKKPKDRYKDNK